jgi:hypothetical protein
MNKRLILKYGSSILLDNVKTKAYFDSVKKTYYIKQIKDYTSFDVEVLHTFKNVTLESIFKINNLDYIVFETYPVYTTGKISYIETVVIKDDFEHILSITNQSLGNCSLPSLIGPGLDDIKARIKTINPNRYTTIALQGGKVATHEIIIRFIEDINIDSLIVDTLGNKKYEILNIENINEKNVFLILNCIEVL